MSEEQLQKAFFSPACSLCKSTYLEELIRALAFGCVRSTLA
jgi:hypothetical protein